MVPDAIIVKTAIMIRVRPADTGGSTRDDKIKSCDDAERITLEKFRVLSRRVIIIYYEYVDVNYALARAVAATTATSRRTPAAPGSCGARRARGAGVSRGVGRHTAEAPSVLARLTAGL